MRATVIALLLAAAPAQVRGPSNAPPARSRAGLRKRTFCSSPRRGDVRRLSALAPRVQRGLLRARGTSGAAKTDARGATELTAAWRRRMRRRREC